VVIAKIDYSKQDNWIPGFTIRGVPHIMLFAASRKSTPVTFGGTRSLDAFINWILTNAGNKVDVAVLHDSLPTQTGPVTTVVAETWKEIVLNKEKHVFVNFFAPWSPYSQRLAPIWRDLAEKMKPYPKLVIADFDGTQNSVPGVDILAFPTTTLYKAEDKSEAQFRGPTRSVEAYEEWLRATVPDAFMDSPTAAPTSRQTTAFSSPPFTPIELPSTISTDPPTESPVNWCRHNPWIYAVFALIIGLLVGFFYGLQIYKVMAETKCCSSLAGFFMGEHL